MDGIIKKFKRAQEATKQDRIAAERKLNARMMAMPQNSEIYVGPQEPAIKILARNFVKEFRKPRASPKNN